MVYVSIQGKTRHGGENMKPTDANDERADGEAGDGVLDQVRGAGTQERRRRPHLRIVVGRLEGFAGSVSVGHSPGTVGRMRAHSLAHGDCSFQR